MGAGRIIYNSIVIDFVRDWNSFFAPKRQFQAISRSAARIRETLNFANQDLVSAMRERLTAQEIIELLQWYDFVRDGTSYEFIRDRDLGGFWAFEKTLNNNDEVAGTFTRSHVANSDSYIDPSTGLLKFAGAANTPRFPAGKYGHGILIEGARTNICQESLDFTGAGWSDVRMDTADDTTDLLDPAGGNNAAKMEATDDNAIIKYTTAVAQGGNDGVFSVDIICMSGTVEGEIQIGSDSPTTDTTVEFIATPEWQRIQVVSENAGGGNWEVRIVIDSDGDILYGYGAQLEVGASVLFASNFMLTDGATVTRADELLLYAATNIINNLKGSIGFWFKPEWIYNKNASAIMYWVHNSGDAARHSSIVALSSGTFEVRVYNGAGVPIEIAPSSAGISQDTWHYLTFTYDTTIANGLKLYIDGALLATSTNDAFVPEEIGTSFSIGSSTAGANEAFCVFDELKPLKNVMSAAQIKSIYARGRGEGLRRNRWAALALTDPDFNPIWKAGNRYTFEMRAEEVIT